VVDLLQNVIRGSGNLTLHASAFEHFVPVFGGEVSPLTAIAFITASKFEGSEFRECGMRQR
jgi:hypothetical protein